MKSMMQTARSGAQSARLSTPGRVSFGWRTWLFTMLLAGGLVMASLPTSVFAEERASHPRKNTLLKRQWGIEIVYVRQTSAGYMLEFRYRVLDAEKASALFERQTKPVLIHADSGARFIVPTPAKTGALRNSNSPKSGNTYWMFFANPGKYVEVGDAVSIEIGDFVINNLEVQ